MLLTLPRELRDRILELVITSKDIPLDLPVPSEYLRLTSSGSDARTIQWPDIPTSAVIPYIPLLLTNRQIHAEVMDAIDQRLDCVYEIHIDLFEMGVDPNDDDTFYRKYARPTWTSIPYLTRHVAEVRATICVRNGPLPGSYNSIFSLGNGGPATGASMLYDILQRTLRVGPMYQDASESLASTGEAASSNLDPSFDRGLTIGAIVMNFVAPVNLPANSVLAPPDWNVGDTTYYSGKGALYVVSPTAAAAVVEGYIDSMMTSYWNSHGKTLEGRVGEIRLAVDGSVYYVWKIVAPA